MTARDRSPRRRAAEPQEVTAEVVAIVPVPGARERLIDVVADLLLEATPSPTPQTGKRGRP